MGTCREQAVNPVMGIVFTFSVRDHMSWMWASSRAPSSASLVRTF